MTTTKRRGRRQRSGSQSTHQAGVPTEAHIASALRPAPEWNWRTFPVFFAFAVGAFAGLYAGMIVAWSDNSAAQTSAFLVVALLLGLGFSRLSSRWMLSRNWIKPRAPKR